MHIFLILLVIAIVIAGYVMFSRNKKLETNAKANAVLINEYEKRLFNIMSNPKNAEFKTELNNLYEDLKYSDKNAVADEDFKLDSIIFRLEKALNMEDRKEVTSTISELKTALARRKMEISDSKRGGF